MKIPLEEIFSSKGAVRIIRTLVTKETINISRLSRETGLSTSQIKRYLSKLISFGLISEMRIGRVRIYKCNFDNQYLLAIKGFIDKWESIRI